MKWRRLLIVLLVLALLLPTAMADQFSFLPSITVDGQEYLARPSSEITTLLLIGYDHYDNGVVTEELEAYHLGGQSDFLLLLVFDHANKQVRQLQFDRDTITDIKLVASNGMSAGTRKTQLCLSHAYGRTREENNRNAIWAVENLLGIAKDDDGAQIDCYISMDISGINKLNELVGGVTVTIPNDDMIAIDPTMTAGTTMTLTGMQAEYFTRYRYNTAEPTNEARMARQRIYMDSLEDLLSQRVREDINYVNTLLGGMGMIIDRTSNLDAGFGFTTTDNEGTPAGQLEGKYLMSDTTMDELAALAARVLDYEIMPVETLPGEHSLGSDEHIHFDLEGNCAVEWALSVFYTPANAQ